MNANISNLLEAWNGRPTTVDWTEDDMPRIHRILIALKNAIPVLRAFNGDVAPSTALPPALSRNPVSEVTAAQNDKNAPTGILERNEPWKPRWEREGPATIPIPANAASADATPNNDSPSVQEKAQSTHNPASSQHTDGTGAVSDQTPGISDSSASVDARLAAARKVAATSKIPSSPKPARRRAKVNSSILP